MEIGAGVSDARNRPGYVGMSEQTVITMSSTTSNNADHFELADIVVRVPSGFRTFGAKRDTAGQINIIAENVSQRFISSEELIESDKECVRGLSKRDCPIKGRFNLTSPSTEKMAVELVHTRLGSMFWRTCTSMTLLMLCSARSSSRSMAYS